METICILAGACSIGVCLWRQLSACLPIGEEDSNTADTSTTSEYELKEIKRIQELQATLIANLSLSRCETIHLRVDRKNCLKDSVAAICRLSPKVYKLTVNFKGEQGIDCGGLTKEWFNIIALSMRSSQYSLFRPSDTDSMVLEPNTLSRRKIQHRLFFLPNWIRQPKHLSYYTFYGRAFGLALCTRNNIRVKLRKSFFDRLLDIPISDESLMDENPQLFGNIQWLKGQDIDPLNLGLTFSLNELDDETGESFTIDLIRNGRNIEVTEKNKEKYIQLMIDYKLKESLNPIIEAFKTGFHEVVPPSLLSTLQVTAKDLQMMINGNERIDISDWKRNSKVTSNGLISFSQNVRSFLRIFRWHANNVTDTPANCLDGIQAIPWFWKAVQSFSEEERLLLLRFVTGSDCVPIGGFANLTQPFHIQLRPDLSAQRLPSSHTCFNRLELPIYRSYDELREKLLTAIREGADNFLLS